MKLALPIPLLKTGQNGNWGFMGRFIDIAGKKFGYLEALEYCGKTKWRCRCKCGNEKTVEGGHLRSGHTKSCGCLHREIQSSDGGTSGKKLVGTQVGRLTVEAHLGARKYRCRCECGNECIVKSENLRSKDTKSCGCLKNEIGDRRRNDLTGQVFGKLTVIRHLSGKEWECRCDCGRMHRALSSNLVTGKTKSCGCLKAEFSRKPRKHGHAGSPTYHSWSHMRQRCNNPNNASYRDYGGRGIKVCARWSKFENFIADMGEKPDGTSLDRINPTDDYHKENCRWADDREQSDNKRNTLRIEYNGQSKTLSQWAREVGVKRATLYQRLYRLNWPVEKALGTGLLRKSHLPTLSHGLSRTKAYRTWSGAKSRCNSPNNKSYKLYGGRGIRMSDAWQNDFLAFLRDMGHPPSDSHSLDRINPDGDYSKDNCRWALPEVQANNKRVVKLIDHNGMKKTISEWSQESGIPAKTIRWRFEHGWPAADAITTPVGKFHRRPSLESPRVAVS